MPVAFQEIEVEDQLLMNFQKIPTVYVVIQTLNERIPATVKTGNTEEQTKMIHEGEATAPLMRSCLQIGEVEKTHLQNTVVVQTLIQAVNAWMMMLT